MCVYYVAAVERRPAGCEVEGSGAKGVYVGCLGWHLASDLLGCHIERGATDGCAVSFTAVEPGSDPEVQDLHLVRRCDKDVTGLEVTVNDVSAVGEGDGVGDPKEQGSETGANPDRVGFHELVQRFAGHELHGDEVAVETLFEVMDGDNTRVVERGRRPGLLAEPPVYRALCTRRPFRLARAL